MVNHPVEVWAKRAAIRSRRAECFTVLAALFFAMVSTPCSAAEDAAAVLTLEVPTVMSLTFQSGNANASYAINETGVLLGDSVTRVILAGVLRFSSNLNNTVLDVKRTNWSYSGPDGGDGAFKLEVRKLDGISYAVMSTAPTVLGTFTNGVNQGTLQIRYRLSEVSVADDPGTYTTTVTYTLHN